MAYFNFDERPELAQFFERGKNVKEIVDNLSLVHGSKIEVGTLLVFDEIQACLPALGSLKYVAENIPDASRFTIVETVFASVAASTRSV